MQVVSLIPFLIIYVLHILVVVNLALLCVHICHLKEKFQASKEWSSREQEAERCSLLSEKNS